MDVSNKETITRSETPCELNDLDWIQFRDKFNIYSSHSNTIGRSRIGLALIGLGRIGLVHLRNILREPRAKLLYCFDIDTDRLNACAKMMSFDELQVKAMCSNLFDCALNDPNVQAIIVATPTNTHESLITRCLDANKSVLCEKPLTLNWHKIMPLFETAKQNKIFLAAAFNRHYDSDWQRMRRKVIQNALGPVQLIRVVSRNGQRPMMTYLKVSGDIFHDTCIHDIDMTLWMMRQLPETVYVMAKSWQQYLNENPDFKKQFSKAELEILPDIKDYFLVTIMMQFSNGSIGMIDTSRYSSYGNDQRCEIYGSKGVIKCDGRYSSNVIELNDSGIAKSGINFTFESRYKRAYESELEDFLTMAELASCGHYNNLELTTKHLSDYPRGTLVAAAMQVADACTEVAKDSKVFKFDWSDEFKKKFEEEMKL